MKNKLILNKEKILNILGKEYSSLTDVFSDKFGIVNAMLERHELDHYNLYMYQCLSANTTELFNSSREVSSGGLGVSENKKIAMTSCLAEALERYCISYIPACEIVKKPKKELKQNETFDDFATYSFEQYENFSLFLNPYTDTIEWTKIYSIYDRKKYKYWPASLIYLPFDLNKPVAETTSTGMAAGFDIDNCIESGLLELIERDALMINFMQRLNPPEIDIETIKGINQELISKIKEEYNIKIYKLYSDIDVPIYLAIIFKLHKKKYHYGIGACASLDSDYAINKALKECLFTYFYSLNIMDVRQSDSKKIKTLYEHFLYYQGDNFKSLLFDSKKIKYKKKLVTFKEVLNSLDENGIEVYYKELTTDDIVNTNIKVVKVVAPTLIDLNKSHIYPRLGAKRFFEVPKKLGLKYNNTLTNMPHPFP